MAGYDRDEVPTLLDTHPTLVDESLDSQSQADMSRTRSMSIFIPMSSMESYETGNNLVGSTAPLRSARRAPLVHGDMNRRDKVPQVWDKVLQVWDKVVQNWDNFFIIQNWDKFFVICCLMAIFLDPLFFFLLSVQQDNKCIAIDWPMTDTIVVFRSVTDFVYLLNILVKFRLAYVAPESRVVGAGGLVDYLRRIAQYLRRIAQNYPFFFLDLYLMLPLPQIIVFTVLRKSLESSSGENSRKNLILWASLMQYIPRLFRFLYLLVGQSPNGLIFETAWANFFINLSTFLLSAHVIGSYWYLLGTQSVKKCLLKACYDSGLANTCLQFINCGDMKAHKEPALNWTSWTKNENATACFSGDSFPYGIYKPAVNLTSKDITTRYVFSVFWGLQQISTLAGNQQPSYFVWEVLFTMLIIGLGLLLFALLIGNMRNFLQAFGQRRLKFSLRQRDVEQWMRHRSLPKPLKERMRAAEKYNWEATRGVNEGMLIENLPEDIQKDIRRHMFEFIKTVRIFVLMDPHILDAICERLKQTIYIKGSQILNPGGVVDKMVFIMRGKLESIEDDGTVTPLCEGSVCGEELLTWFLEHALGSKDGKKTKVTGQRLHSNRTVRCVTNVEPFSLQAADLEEVTDYFASLRNHEYKEP